MINHCCYCQHYAELQLSTNRLVLHTQ